MSTSSESDPSDNEGTPESTHTEDPVDKDVPNGEEEEEENVLALWQKFIMQKNKNIEREKGIKEKTKIFQRKAENPVRALLLSTMKAYVKKDLRQITKFIPDMEREVLESFLQQKKNLTEAQSRSFQLLKLVNWIMNNKAKDYIINIICALQLRVICEKKDKIEWLAVQLQPRRSVDHNQAPMPQAQLINFTRNWRSSLDDLLDLEDDQDEMTVVQSKTESPFAFVAVLTLRTTRRKQRSKTVLSDDISIRVAAFNPHFPYVFFHEVSHKWTLPRDAIENFVKALGLEYTAFKPLRLRDTGLQSVYTSCLKSITVGDIQRLKQRLNTDSPSKDDSSEMLLQAPAIAAKRRKRILSAAIDDKEEGGFKHLTFQFKSSTQKNNSKNGSTREKTDKYSVVMKFKSKKGNMDEAFLTLLENDAIQDPTMYLLAKAKKTNFLVLD